jgi:hypothetical protein
MPLFLTTILSAEQCIERLRNAIDAIPPPEERVASAVKTTWSSTPLPAVGLLRRTMLSHCMSQRDQDMQ